MRTFRTLLTVIFLSISSIRPAWGADGPGEFGKILEELPGSRIEADYSFSLMQNDVPVLYSGHAVLQQGYFHISGNGLEIFCDGTAITYMDFEAKEAYIESAVRIEDYVSGNLQSIKDLKISNVRKSPASDELSIFKAPATDRDWVTTDLR